LHPSLTQQLLTTLSYACRTPWSTRLCHAHIALVFNLALDDFLLCALHPSSTRLSHARLAPFFDLAAFDGFVLGMLHLCVWPGFVYLRCTHVRPSS
jgi:hypothetical protein